MKLQELYKSEFCNNCQALLTDPKGLCEICNLKEKEPTFIPEDPYIFDKTYKVSRCLGKGGMGNVYEVLHLALNEKRALKIMKLEYSLEEEMKKRFLREAKIMASLDSPFLTKVFDFGVEDELLYYIIMEFIDGIPLKNFLTLFTQIPIDLKILMFSQILKGISNLHSKKIVHRDLSLDNIMLLKEPTEDCFIKIIDLGLSKNLKKQEDITKKETFFGKFLYSPPEYFTVNFTEMDFFKVDSYALGVIFYVILAGKYPFYAQNTKQLINLVLSKEPDPIDGLDDELWEIVLKALHKNPLERYDSAINFSKSLDNYIKNSKIIYDKEKIGENLKQYFFADNLLESIKNSNYDLILSLFDTHSEKYIEREIIKSITRVYENSFIEEQVDYLLNDLSSQEPLKSYSCFLALLDLFIENPSDEIKELLAKYEIILRDFSLLYQCKYYLSIGELKPIEDLISSYEFSESLEELRFKIKSDIENFKNKKNSLRKELEENISKGNFSFIAEKMNDLFFFNKEEPNIIMQYLNLLYKHVKREQISSSLLEAEEMVKNQHYETAYSILNNIDISKSEDENLNNKFLHLIDFANKGIKALEILNQINNYYNNGEIYKCAFSFIIAKKNKLEEFFKEKLNPDLIEKIIDKEKEINEKIRSLENFLSSYDLVNSEIIIEDLLSMNPPQELISEYLNNFEEIKKVVLDINKAEEYFFSNNLEKAKEIIDQYIKKYSNYSKIITLKKLVDEKLLIISSKTLIEKSEKILKFLNEKKFEELNQLLLSIKSYDENNYKIIKNVFLEKLKKQKEEELKTAILYWIKKIKYDDSILIFFNLMEEYLKKGSTLFDIYNKYKSLENIFKEVEEEISNLIKKLNEFENSDHKNISNTLKNIFNNKKYESAIIILKMHLKRYPKDTFVQNALEKITNFSTVLKKLNE